MQKKRKKEKPYDAPLKCKAKWHVTTTCKNNMHTKKKEKKTPTRTNATKKIKWWQKWWKVHDVPKAHLIHSTHSPLLCQKKTTETTRNGGKRSAILLCPECQQTIV
jgi:hypothetical protein